MKIESLLINKLNALDLSDVKIKRLAVSGESQITAGIEILGYKIEFVSAELTVKFMSVFNEKNHMVSDEIELANCRVSVEELLSHMYPALVEAQSEISA